MYAAIAVWYILTHSEDDEDEDEDEEDNANKKKDGYINIESATNYILSCKSYEGALGLTPGREGHGGSTFCGVASLYLMGVLDKVMSSGRKEDDELSGVWKDDLLAVNGFDEDYEGWGREDSDLGARLYNLGLSRKMVYGRALVYHLNHPENKRDQLSQNDKRLKETISSGKTRCTNGLAKESPQSVESPK